jgi:hypothetical protein
MSSARHLEGKGLRRLERLPSPSPSAGCCTRVGRARAGTDAGTGFCSDRAVNKAEFGELVPGDCYMRWRDSVAGWL